MPFSTEVSRSALRILSLLALLCSIASCALFSSDKKQRSPLRTISLVAMPDANQGYSVEVDIVVILDKNLNAVISNLSAAQWFVQKSRFQQDYPKQLLVVHREPMPGSSDTIKLKKRAKKASSILVFANYLNQSHDHRANIATMDHARVTLDKYAFNIASKSAVVAKN